MNKKKILIGASLAIIAVVAIALLQPSSAKKIGYCFNNSSDSVSISTPQADPAYTRFIALGDSGENSPSLKSIAISAKKYCETNGCDFGLLLGDNFYENGLQSLADKENLATFEDNFNSANIPFYAVLGNHDVKGDTQAQIEYSKVNKNWIMPNYNFKFATNQAEFYATNSNCGFFPIFWYLKQDKNLSKWQVQARHHSLLSLGPHGNSDALDRFISANFTKTNINIAGHNHLLEYIESAGISYLTSGAASRPSVDKTISTDPSPKFSYDKAGYVWVELSQDSAKFRYLDENSNLLYESEVQRHALN